MKDTTYDVVIIGAGLSGLSSGYYLDKIKILILESRDVVGGRTSSWDFDGMIVESGLHRMLGFYEELPGLMKASGIDLDKAIIWEDQIEIRLPDISAEFGLSLFKPAFTLEKALGNNSFISPSEKLTLSQFFISGFKDLNSDRDMDSITVEQYASEKGLNKDIIFRVLTPLTEGLFFLPPHKYSAYNFFSLFSPYIPRLYKTRAGAFSGGMTDVLCRPIADAIVKKGGEIKTNSKVDRLIIENNQVEGIMVKGVIIKTKKIIIAASIKEVQRLIRESVKDDKLFEDFLKIKTMPSVTFQLDLKERSLPVDRATFSPGTIFASYSEQSKTTFRHVPGRLSIILSTPEKYLKKTKEEILEVVLEDAKKLNINLKKENILKYRKISWASDFYSYEPGYAKLIPSAETPIKGLVLAGDYTRQKYLQTMEGAVYSGKIAAQLLS
jgi:15-cis-phytoene desaturase